MKRALPRSFYYREAEGKSQISAEQVARDLLGAILFSSIGGRETSGRIVETEAYLGPHDDASHAAERIGRTPRNEVMFGRAGNAYVYRIYGSHWCLNAVTGPVGFPSAVLIRALEPLTGLDVMHERRDAPGGGRSKYATGERRRPLADVDLCAGPGRLAAALAIDGSLDGHALQQPPLWIARGDAIANADVIASPRVGITRAADWPLRFSVAGSRWVSRPKPK